MGIFYPDNPKRERRLQQLVNGVTNIQHDIRDLGAQLSKESPRLRDATNQVLTKSSLPSVEELVHRAAGELPSEAVNQYHTLMKSAEKLSDGFDITTLGAGHMFLFQDDVQLTPASLVAVGEASLGICMTQGVTRLFEIAAQGDQNALTQAFSVFGEKSSDVLQSLQAVIPGLEKGVSFFPTYPFGFLGLLGGGAKDILGEISKILIPINPMELFEGGEVRARLISGIHQLQCARLSVAYFKAQVTNVLEEVRLLILYLEQYTKSLDSAVPEADRSEAKAAATGLRNRIVKTISDADHKINWHELERNLEAQDKSVDGFYGDADLDEGAVVAAAQTHAVVG